jgi:hypothetical protein
MLSFLTRTKRFGWMSVPGLLLTGGMQVSAAAEGPALQSTSPGEHEAATSVAPSDAMPGQVRLIDADGGPLAAPADFEAALNAPAPSACDLGACDDCHSGLCENLSFSASVVGFKGPVDLGNMNGNFGTRFGLNWGHPLCEDYGLGIQLGTALTIADFRGTEFTGDDSERKQIFTTIGLFQRRDCGLNLGFAYDFLHDDYYHDMDLQQWRLQIGYELDCEDEVGIRVARGTRGDSGRVFTVNPAPPPPVLVGTEHRDPMTQGSIFWKRNWECGNTTSLWLGIAEEHGEFVFGSDFHVPLTDKCALVGEAAYISPSGSSFPAAASEEIWSLSIGVAIYPSRGARHISHSAYAPLLPVASNATFAVDKLPD